MIKHDHCPARSNNHHEYEACRILRVDHFRNSSMVQKDPTKRNFLSASLNLFKSPSIIPSAFLLHAKNCGTMQQVSPEYNSITHSQVKKSMIHYFYTKADMYVLTFLIIYQAAVKFFNMVIPR